MCGRYASSRPPDLLAEDFDVDDVETEPLPPRWNVAPTLPVYAVLERHDRRRLRALRWGLVPSWATDASIGSRLINARAESVENKPAFRKALAVRRCVLPADGYYEWYARENGPRRKQPFYIRSRDGAPLAFAGLYEFWRDPADPDSELVTSCTIITSKANDEMALLHDRMPVLLARNAVDAWLDPEVRDVEAVRGLLAPAPLGLLEAYPVSPLVSNVRNEGEELIAPIAADESDAPEGTLF